MTRIDLFALFNRILVVLVLILGVNARTAAAQTAAAPNASAPLAAEQAKTASTIELYVDYSEDSFAEEATLKELTSVLRYAVKAELEAGDFKVTMLDAPAPAPANAPYLLKVRLTDYRTIGVQRAIYARYELVGGGKIVKHKLTQSTVKSALQLPKVLGKEIVSLVRERIRGVQ